MTLTTITSRVGADGVLSVTVPLGPAEANREVVVTIEPANQAAKKAVEMTQEEWSAWIKSMAGVIKDPDFRRHEQGDFEVRDELP